MTKTIAEPVQASSVEPDDEETTEQPPLTSSTTSRRPVVTSTSFPSTTPAPQILQFPSSSPETIAALLALHKAFTQSLRQHSSNKDKVNPPKLTGFVESLDPAKATQQAETFEIKSVPTPSSPRVPTPFSPKTQSQFSIQQSPLKPQYQSQPKPQYQSPPKPQFQSPPKPQYQSPPKPQYQSPPKPQYQSPPKPQYQSPPKPQYHNPPKTQYQSPPKPQYQSPLKPQFQNPPKPPPPLTLPPVTYPKPVQATSERYGNTHFHHSFHINTQIDHFPDNYQDQYADHESQPSSQPQTEAPKQYDFNDYDEEDYYDEKPQTSTITPYLLHQIKVNQVRNANQAKASSINHGSFVREVSSPTQTKPFSVPSFRSVTTPGIAIITATSTTSSSSVKTSKPALSAIQLQKEIPSTAGFVSSLLHDSETNITQQYADPPQSYDDYIEGDVHSDPFYKDVPKIGRKKRSPQEELESSESFVNLNHSTLTKLKDKLLDIVFKYNSDIVLRAIIKQYCNNNQSNATSRLVSLCLSDKDIRIASKNTERLGDKWKIVIPKRDSNHLYLVKTISSSNDYQNSTSNILLLVNFPDEFKLIRDSVVEQLEQEELSNDIFRNVSLNSVNNLVHHRFKRIRRNRPQISVKNNIENNSNKRNVPIKRTKKARAKRQAYTRIPDENLDLGKSAQRNGSVRPMYQRTRGRGEPRVNTNSQRSQVIPNPRELETEDVPELQRPQRVRQRRPQSRRPSLASETPRLSQARQEESTHTPKRPNVEESVEILQPLHNNAQPPLRQLEPEARSSTETSNQDKYLGGRPSSKRRGQGTRYHYTENIPTERNFQQRPDGETDDGEVEVSTTYPFNLKPGTQFSCDDKIKGGYYADVEAECYGYFICSQGEINGP